MMHMEYVTLMPAVAAGLLMFIIGHVWYHARVFGSVWMRLTNITPDMAESGRRWIFLTSFAGLLGALLLAVALGYLGRAIGVETPAHGVVFASLMWLCVIVPVLVGNVLWEGKPFGLFAINAGYWLAALLVAAPVLFI